MSGPFVTVPAYYDGSQIQLDMDIELRPETRLLVTILADEAHEKSIVVDMMRASEAALDRMWNNEDDAIYDNL